MNHIIVTAAPDSIQHQRAIEFAEHSIQSGHSVSIFFYSDAVTIAKSENAPKHQLRWAALLEAPKHLCIGAAETRALDSSNINSAFQLSGLGELAEMLMQTNVIHFKS